MCFGENDEPTSPSAESNSNTLIDPDRPIAAPICTENACAMKQRKLKVLVYLRVVKLPGYMVTTALALHPY